MAMKRAVLLGTGAFPFIITYWMKMLKLWDEAVDKVYIAVDHYNVPEAKEFIRKKAKENNKIVLLDENVYSWPGSYKYAFEKSQEDVFLIMHDDTFVFDKNIIDKYFKIAEQDTVVTPIHLMYNPYDVIEDILRRKYPGKVPWIASNGTKGYSFLLNFLFISRTNLNKTSLDFGGYAVKANTYNDLLDTTPVIDLGGDTGWKTGLELLKNNVEIMAIPEYKIGMLNYIPDALKVLMGDFGVIKKHGWIHLSNTGNTIPLWFQDINADSPNWTSELQRMRLAWFLEMLECDEYEEIPEIKKKGYDILNKLVKLCNLDMDTVIKFKTNFHNLIWQKS